MSAENFLSAIESVKGENLTSAVLAYLLRQHNELLNSLLNSTSGFKFDNESDIKVETEFATEHEVYGKGRLDILIEVPNKFVIGIENKIWAPFGNNQLAKYCKTMLSRAKSLRTERVLLLVLAPKRRQTEIERELNKVRIECQGKQLQFNFISWRELLKNLKKQIEDISESHFLTLQLEDYVSRDVWFDTRFTEVISQLYKSDELWNDSQGELVKHIWHLFPEQGYRIEKSHGNYIGYQFYRNREPPANQYVYGWYGFVNTATQLDIASSGVLCRPVEFVINFGPKVIQLPKECCSYLSPAPFSSHAWSNNQGWIVKIADDWSTPAVWQQKLKPLLDLFNEALLEESKSQCSLQKP